MEVQEKDSNYGHHFQPIQFPIAVARSSNSSQSSGYCSGGGGGGCGGGGGGSPGTSRANSNSQRPLLPAVLMREATLAGATASGNGSEIPTVSSAVMARDQEEKELMMHQSPPQQQPPPQPPVKLEMQDSQII